MALKSDKVIPITTLKAKPRCGDCLHFKHISKFEKVCNTLGIKQFAEAPTCFSPNIYVLTKKNPDTLHQLGMLLRDWTPAETRVFMALLRQKIVMDKNYGLQFGQPVMFKIGGGDYLSNYFKGYVIEGMTALRSMLGTVQALKAMKSNEELTNRRYMEALHLDLPEDIRAVVEQNRDDERRHLDYIVRAIDQFEHPDVSDRPRA